MTRATKLLGHLAGSVLLLIGCWPAAAEPAAPPAVVRVGATEKICQLTGEVDWETNEPTAAKTFSNFGLDGVDLGYPVETGNKLILLFGDAWPPPHGGGQKSEIPPDDAVGEVVRTDPPSKDGGCLGLQIHSRHDPKTRFAPATITGPIAVKQGFFNVPTGGVAANGSLFAFFWTDHCYHPTHLAPAPDNPFDRPKPSDTCPETDEHSSVGRGVLAHSGDDGWTFTDVVPMPSGFVYSTAIDATAQPDLPPDDRLGIFVFGVPRFRASIPYLALAPVATLRDPSTWQFHVGRGTDGNPKWVTRAEWDKLPAGSAQWKPPGEAELFAPGTRPGRCVGEFSVTWNRPLHAWLMLYNCLGEVEARVAPAPWGPWSAPTVILGSADPVACHFVMSPDGCGTRRDFMPKRRVGDKLMPGSFYAPFVLDRYTKAADLPGGHGTTIYWLVSTWNPYEVTVVRTTLRAGSP